MTGRLSTNEEDVRSTALSLREHHTSIFGRDAPEAQERVLRAFAAFASLWEDRLRTDWMPPAEILFPWTQVQLSLAALLPGFAEAGEWLTRSGTAETGSQSVVTALILAGNTPLLAWSPLAAALLAGHVVFVKQSRDETVWTRLFVEALAEFDLELAALIHLDLWPGDDPRTKALVQSADAVIAYGSNASIAALRGLTPTGTPFFPFGHAVSIGIVAADGAGEAGRFARDILLYNQSGCLSAQAVLVEERDGITAEEVARSLAESLEKECAALGISPVTDPAVARTVRQARDMALFLDDVSLIGDPALRWTVLARSSPAPLDFPAGSCVVQVVPLQPNDSFSGQLGALRAHLSCVGVAGEMSEALRQAVLLEGVSRVCRAGEMQMPLLSWPNGNKNLLSELLKAELSPENDKGLVRNTQT